MGIPHPPPTICVYYLTKENQCGRSQLLTNRCRFFLRQGWYTTADFVDRVWTVNHQPADHWRALQLHTVLQQLSLASDLVTCQACVEHEFIPVQCSQQNQSGELCAALLAGYRGTS